jgi:hypothetical protein
MVCSCDGRDEGDGCGHYSEPFRHFGSCSDAVDDATVDAHD